jgi:hypothetical protein
MAQNTITNITRDEIIEALEFVRSTNDHLIGSVTLADRRIFTDLGRFDVDIAADAILAGKVEPDCNEHENDEGQIVRIDDEVAALAFGAFMSSGAWWVEEQWTRLTSSTPDAVARELAALAGSDATEDDGEQLRDHMTRWGLLRRRGSAAEIVEIVELSDDEWHDLIVWAL